MYATPPQHHFLTKTFIHVTAWSLSASSELKNNGLFSCGLFPRRKFIVFFDAEFSVFGAVTFYS